jgi:hypothetical protein
MLGDNFIPNIEKNTGLTTKFSENAVVAGLSLALYDSARSSISL